MIVAQALVARAAPFWADLLERSGRRLPDQSLLRFLTRNLWVVQEPGSALSFVSFFCTSFAVLLDVLLQLFLNLLLLLIKLLLFELLL